MKKFHSLLCLLLILTFASCNPNDDNNTNPNDDEFAQNFGNSVARDFIGQDVDVDNLPVQGVTV